MNTITIPRPTLDWKKQLNDGSEHFTEVAIIESNILIDNYLSALEAANNENTIWKAIETVVKSIRQIKY